MSFKLSLSGIWSWSESGCAFWAGSPEGDAVSFSGHYIRKPTNSVCTLMMISLLINAVSVRLPHCEVCSLPFVTSFSCWETCNMFLKFLMGRFETTYSVPQETFMLASSNDSCLNQLWLWWLSSSGLLTVSSNFISLRDRLPRSSGKLVSLLPSCPWLFSTQ